MKTLIQRVKNAKVEISGEIYSETNKGILAFCGIEKDDKNQDLIWTSHKIKNLRIFPDSIGRMSYSLNDIKGELMVVSQFTLSADCKKGNRPSFDNAEKSDKAKEMYERFLLELTKNGIIFKTGKFGAMMDISCTNWGPVTFILEHKS